MGTKVQRRAGGKNSGRPAFKIAPIALMLAVAPMTPVAFAQSSGASDGTAVITVTGIRKAIEDAVSVKKGSDMIVEAISAEDIGKLPDASVAESISRLPGVTAQRNKSTGKAQNVSVRGMSPDFNGALLNGREQASTGDSRGVEFDQFPSELLGSVVIYKTPDASLTGQGLASTIDMRTVRPLDFRKRTVAVNYRDQKTGVDSGAGEGTGDRVSFSYVDQFADRKLGVAIGYAKFKENGAEQLKTNTWGGWTPEIPYRGVNVKTPGGFGGDTEQGTTEREGTMAVLQYKPNKEFESVFDYFSSKGTTSLKKTGLEGSVGGLSAGGYDPSGVLTTANVVNGVAVSGTIDKFKGVIRNHLEAGDDELTSWGWNNKFKLGEWATVADIAQSKVVRDSSRYETTAGQLGNATALDSISWTGFNGNNHADVKFTTALNYTDRSVMKLTDVMGWSGGAASPQAGYVALPHVTDKIDSYKLTGKRPVTLGPINAAEIGFNYVNREKVRQAPEGRLVVSGGPFAAATAPGTETALAGTWGIPVIKWDPRGSLGTIYQLAAKVDPDILNKDWGVEEKVATTFVKGDLDGELFGLPYRGNAGVQFVSTDQSSTGFNVDRVACTGNTPATCPGKNVTAGATYTDVNPSLNLNFDLGGDKVMRLGIAKVMSRPNMGDMRASMGFGVNTTDGNPILSGSAGNPALEPFRANSFDLSFEKYFGNKGYFSVAGFYKDLDTYILNVGIPYDFKNFVVPSTQLPASGPNKGSTKGILTTPINGSGGSIKGVELALNIPFSMLTKMLDGFGVMINHSSTTSTLSLPRIGFGTDSIDGLTIPLPGLSKNVTNTRLYYENYGFQIAVAQRKRSDFLGEISDFQDNRRLSFIKGETILDLQASYEFSSGWFKGMSVLFQGNNLGNAEFQRYNTDRNNPTEKVKYGKTYLMGINYKF